MSQSKSQSKHIAGMIAPMLAFRNFAYAALTSKKKQAVYVIFQRAIACKMLYFLY